jgi:outer membrane protein OmpA-like peptidoglycan-associated protein
MKNRTIFRVTTAVYIALVSLAAAEEPKVVEKDKILGVLEKKPSLTRSISAAPKPAISIQSILFKFGSADVEGAQSYEQIKQLGQALSDPRLKDSVVEIQGHADNVGSAEANQKLSEARATKIVEMLTHLYSVPAQNLKAVGKGLSAPVAGTKEQQSDEERALNRRVVIERQK